MTEKNVLIPNVKEPKHYDIDVYSLELPKTIRGVTMQTGNDSFKIVLNANDSEEQNYIAFLHEATHIYRNDFAKDATVSDIEEETHSLIRNALEMLQAH